MMRISQIILVISDSATVLYLVCRFIIQSVTEWSLLSESVSLDFIKYYFYGNVFISLCLMHGNRHLEIYSQRHQYISL